MGGFTTPTINQSTGVGAGKALQTQLGNLTGLGNTQLGQRTSEVGSLLPGYSSLMNSGYSPQEKSAINQSTLGGINATYAGANAAAQRRAARTGNTAGYGSFLNASARGRAGALAQQNLQNQQQFADETLRRKLIGLQGIQGLYGIDTGFLANVLGQQNQLLGMQNQLYGIQKSKSNMGDIFTGSLLGSLGGALGGII